MSASSPVFAHALPSALPSPPPADNTTYTVRAHIQWNLYIEDTIGTNLAVLYREVSLIQRKICTQLYVVGTADSVLIREVSFIQCPL